MCDPACTCGCNSIATGPTSARVANPLPHGLTRKMADPEAAKLCTQIVRSHFGPLTAVRDYAIVVYSRTLTCNAQQTIASALLIRGRLNLGQIVQFTSLKPRTVRAAVIVLFQQNLLWRSSADEEKEVLEFNVDECLTRLRFGRYVWWAEKKCGPLVSLPTFHGLPLIELPLGWRDCSVSVGSRKIEAARYLSVVTEVHPKFV